MPLRDLLKKKDKLGGHHGQHGKAHEAAPEPDPKPEFVFMRSDTHSQNIISPPSFSSAESSKQSSYVDAQSESRTSKGFFGRNRSSSAVSNISAVSNTSNGSDKSKNTKRLSQRLHFRKSDVGSAVVPQNLPAINAGDGGEGAESQWEKRATLLAGQNQQERSRSRPGTPTGSAADLAGFRDMSIGGQPVKETVALTKQTDDNIQEAIRLHEAGDLERSTAMFGRLADPDGENNALSQVLYGLALRHGWGIAPNPTEAVKYLSAAAANAGQIEKLALDAGMTKGGAAKGELVLAIFELANCYRHGWGVTVDKVAAQNYYETAANLGDTDAMNEVAWCYIEGFGCKKDKWAAAKYYRLAEKAGSKTLGNSWIWKEKYDTPKK
ncbi:hypothetical protein B0J14DRAFT_619177 [Halenospora varia]|nr:hypothetical protein B0J14DRAFT_619177 [Halenospora varia]